MPSIYRSAAGEQAVMALYDSMLARWPVPYTTLHVPTRHGNTFVIVSGEASAPPLVLLHGAGNNSAMWAGDVAEYSRQYRVLAIDLPGEPGKSTPDRLPWNSPAYAEWLNDVLNALKVEAATLIGLSQGGWTALKFATAYPERVTRLVVLSPGGVVVDKGSFIIRAIPLLLLGRWGHGRMISLVLGGQLVPADIQNALLVMMTHFKPRVGRLPIFSDKELRRLTMPVQLIMGERDALRDADRIMARMKQLVPHLNATTIPGAGHAVVNARTYVLPFLASSAL